MKLETIDRDIKTNTKPCNVFTMRADSHMFNILIKQYHDPQFALQREIACNARDSMIEAGKESQPFEIELPTKFNPTFRCRDFGVGMSQEYIEKEYTIAGHSSKSQSNEYTGAFGIGRLSCFAYVDQYTLTSWYNGTKYVYIIALNQEGLPQPNFVAAVPSNEPQGVEISCPVKTQDIDIFNKKASKVYEHFNPRPDFKSIVPNYIQKTYIIQQPDFAVCENQTKFKIVMGCIEYPCPVISDFDINTQNMLEYAGLELKCNIGEIDITPSRDAVELTTKTKNFIKSRLANIKTFMEKHLEKEFKSCKNLYEARLFYTKISGKIQHIVNMLGVTWQGQKIETQVKLYDYFNGEKPPNTMFFRTGWGKKKKEIQSLDITPHLIFIFNDMKKGAYVRCEEARNGGKSVLLINDEDALKVVCNKVGFDKSYVSNVSTLPKPPAGSIIYRETLRFENWNELAKIWESVKLKDIKTGDFIYVRRYKNTCRSFDHQSFNFHDILNLMRELKFTIPNIYGVRNSEFKRIEGRKNWIHFLDWAKEEFKKYAIRENIEDSLGKIEVYNQLKIKELVQRLPTIKSELEKGDLLDFIQKYPDYNKNREKLALITELANKLSCSLKKNSHIKLLEEEKELYTKYPVLTICGDNAWALKPASFMKTLNFCIRHSNCKCGS